MKAPKLAVLMAWMAVTAAMAEPPRCTLIATGGTIAMRPAEPDGAPVPADSGEAMVAAVPELAGVARLDVESLANVPSPHMTPELWQALHAAVETALAADDVAGVIVTHGTDTLEETAFFLDLTVAGDKPVVLTGAMRDASARDFDGPRNLLAAARLCVDPRARGRGALLVMDDRVHAARSVRKGHTARGDFHSGAAGALGEVGPEGVAFWRSPERRQRIRLEAAALPRVDIVAAYPGAGEELLQAAMAAGSRGIVVQALGLGNVGPALAAGIEAVLDAGVPVVVASRVAEGATAPVYGYAGGGAALRDAGAIFAGDLSPQKARILLMLALQHAGDADALQAFFGP